jgi:hypothetical protein
VATPTNPLPPARRARPRRRCALATFGADLDGAVRIHDIVFQARGTANAQLVAHREFLHDQRYLRELSPTFLRRNAIFFPENVPDLPDLAYGAAKLFDPTIEPSMLVWGVGSIWEAYTGWFQLRSTTELYPVPRSAVDAEVVALTDGPGAAVERARARLTAGQPVAALHLVDMALTADAQSDAALAARLAALEALLVASGGVNHYEVYWLRHRIASTREQLRR